MYNLKSDDNFTLPIVPRSVAAASGVAPATVVGGAAAASVQASERLSCMAYSPAKHALLGTFDLTTFFFCF